MKIGLRILVGYFVIVALAGLLLARVFVQEVKPGVRQAMEDTLVDTANVLAELASDDYLAGRIDTGSFARRVRALGGRDLGARIWSFPKRRVNYRVYVTDARGIVVFDSGGRDVGKDYSRWNDVYLTLQGKYGARSTRSDPNDENSTVMHVAAPIRNDDGRIVGVLAVAKPNQAIAPFIARSQQVVMRWGLLLLGVALAVGILAAWWLSRQLGSLQRYAIAVTAGEHTSPPDAPGEFGDLGRALETMRIRLEGKQYVEQYVHALTHELKSPLTAIRSASELLDQPPGGSLSDADRARFVTTVRDQAERMAQMIDKLLALAAVEHRQMIEQPEVIDAATVLRDAKAQLERKGVDAKVGIHLATPDACTSAGAMPALVLHGDRFLLRQALVNLLDNAVDFSPAGSTVEVGVASMDGSLHITVADRGPGVPDYAVDRVFERFYSLPRPDGGSRSSGIGLPFAAQVAALHRGRCTLVNREGSGAIATLILPLSVGPT